MPRPDSVSRADPSVPRVEITPERLAGVERALAQFIGPMAKVLIKRELPRAADFDGLCQALAKCLDRPEQQAKFLASVPRGKPAA